MFKRRESGMDEVRKDVYEPEPKNSYPVNQGKNTLLKGSRLTGDIIVSYDLELNGEVEGNIVSEKKSNVMIRGVCKGNIKTDEGSVTIEGEFNDGDILSGGDVRITGKFRGGRIEAKGKIYINGEFNGTLQGNEIEIGSDAQGSGEFLYREYISIAKGSKVEVRIAQIKDVSKDEMKPDAGRTDDIEMIFELPSKSEGELTIH